LALNAVNTSLLRRGLPRVYSLEKDLLRGLRQVGMLVGPDGEPLEPGGDGQSTWYLRIGDKTHNCFMMRKHHLLQEGDGGAAGAGDRHGAHAPQAQEMEGLPT